MPPFFIAALLRPLPIYPRQICSRRRLDSRRLRQFASEIPHRSRPSRAARCNAWPHWPPAWSHRSQSSCLSPDPPSPATCNIHSEHLPVRLHIDQPSGSRDRRVIGWRLIQTQRPGTAQAPTNRRPARQCRVPNRCPRNNQSAAVGSRFPASDSDVPSPRKTARTGPRRTHRTLRVQHLIQALIERMAAGDRQLVRGDPQARCPCSILASTHGHAESVVRGIDRVDPFYPLTTGC